MKCIIYISYCNNLKNKLHQSFFEALKMVERIVWVDKDALMKDLSSIVKHLNENHPRCKPINLVFTDGIEHKDIILHSGTGIHASILTVFSKKDLS